MALKAREQLHKHTFCLEKVIFNSPLQRMSPFLKQWPELSSLCSLSSGYHGSGGEEAVFPNVFHPRRERYRNKKVPLRLSEVRGLCSFCSPVYSHFGSFSPPCRVLSVPGSLCVSELLCCVSAVCSFVSMKPRSRHIMQRGRSLQGRTPPLCMHPPSLCPAALQKALMGLKQGSFSRLRAPKLMERWSRDPLLVYIV